MGEAGPFPGCGHAGRAEARPFASQAQHAGSGGHGASGVLEGPS